jgi:Protein of unknown function (DUF3052)
MPGYSGTPLPKKLGLREKSRIALINMPPDVKRELRDAIASCEAAKEGEANLDFAMLFTKEQAKLKQDFGLWAKRLAPAGMLWISWPKKTSGVANDLDENKVREIGLNAGLVDVKVCAVTDVWSGLKFVRRVKDR